MVKVWNYITRMIHDWPLHCFVFGAKNWMSQQHGGLRCFWAESWWMTPEGLADRISLRAASSHKATPGTWRQRAEWRDMEDCGIAFFLYIPIIYQCVGDYWGKEVLDLMLCFGGAILANASDLLLLCYVIVCFFSRFQACPCKAIILC